jgi:hypothetical protein
MLMCACRYHAATQPFNLDELKLSGDVDMEDAGAEPEDEEEEEEEDAPLEDIKDLYEEEDDEEGTGKKRKRRATDDGAQKTKKKVQVSIALVG